MAQIRIYCLVFEFISLAFFYQQVFARHLEAQGTFNATLSDEFYLFCEFPIRPVGIYPLDKNHSTNDVSPNQGTGKAVGVRWAPGILGDPDGSLLLQGNIGSYVELNKGRLDTKKSLTILAFIHPAGSDGPIVNYKVDGYGVQLWETKHKGDGTLMARFNRRDLTYTTFISKRTLKKNQWNYVGASYDYLTGEASLWHEGSKVASKVVGRTQLATQFNVRLGALAMVGLKKYYKGRIACLQFYPEALTSNMIERARDACKPFAPVSTVTLSAEHHDDEYIEVGDTITFTAITDNGDRFSHYTFNPGDGSPETNTEENALTHRYSTYGNFTADVLIWSQCRNRSLHVDIQLTVEKPVELLKGLTLLCNHTEFPESTKFTLRSDLGTDFNCIWNFGDGETSRSSHTTGAEDQIVLHAYNATGNYSVDISCSNRLSQATASGNAVVQIPITGLRLALLPPQRHREAFKITWQVQTGSDIKYSAAFAGKDLHVTKHEQNQSAEAWVLEKDHVGLGLYDVTVAASNDVTHPMTAITRVLVEETVVPFQPKLVHRNRDIEEGEVFSLDMTDLNQLNGAWPTFSVDFGDGEPIVRTKNQTINYSYDRYGNYLVSISTSNYVSRFNTTVLVKIQKPVILLEGLRLSSDPTKHPNPAVITVNIDKGSDFICLANYSDGEVKQYDYRRMFLYDPNRNPKKVGLKHLRFEVKHRFKKDGAYLLRLSCMNRLSELKSSLYVIVQSPVRGFLLSSTPAQAFGKAVNISWQIASGTNATSEVIFRGHRLKQEMNGTHGFVLIGQEVYQDAILHQFSVAVWNLVTSPVSKTGKVSVEIGIEELRAGFIHESDYIEVNATVVFNASVEVGGSPEYVFDFGDNSEAVIKPAITRHSFNPQGVYIVRVTARNNVSQETVELIVTIQKPVVKLVGLTIDAKPTNLSETTEISLRVTEGSDFQCYWQLGDSQRQNYSYGHLSFYKDGRDASKASFTDLSFNIYHTYSQVLIYHPTVVCKNRLSSAEAWGKIVIQKPISGFDIESISPQSTGKSFFVRWSITSGTNASYDVDFGPDSTVSVTSHSDGGYANITSSSPGWKLLRVRGWNLVTPAQVRWKSVLLQVPLSNLSLLVSYDSRDLEIGQIVYFKAQLTEGSDPLFLINFGDGTEVASRLGHEPYNYSFHSSYLQGNPYHIYNAKVFAFNNVSTANAFTLVKVYKPVVPLEDLTLLTSPANVSVPTRIILQLTQGSDITCIYDFGDGNNTVVEFKETVFLGEAKTPRKLFQNLTLGVEHIYKTASTYQVYVQCKNRHGGMEGKTEVVVQTPISGLAIKKVPTMLFGKSFEVEWHIQSGSDVKYDVYLGNTTVPNLQSTTLGGKVLLTPQVYILDGFHTVTVIATNLLSSLSEKIQVTIQIPVTTLELNVSYEEPETGKIRGGYELLGDHFPALRDLNFNAKVDAGTHLVFYWNITYLGPVRNFNQSNLTNSSSARSNPTQLVTRKPVLQYKFQEMGKYNISVKASNDLSQSGSSVNITVLYPVDGLKYESNSPQMMNRLMKFNFTAGTFGYEPCLAFDTGANFTYRQGYAWCGENLGSENFTVITELPDVLHYEHIYSFVNQYPVTLNISNRVSFISFKGMVDVTLAPCSDPLAVIKNIGKTSSQATRVYRSVVFTVKTALTARCSRTKKVRFSWQLSTGQGTDQFLPNGTTTKDKDHDVNNGISLNSRELFLPKRSLPYGLYEVKFTARMDLEDTFKASAIGYLEIIPSPLVAKISGGNLIRRGFGKKVNVDGTNSKDPDVLHGDPGLRFLWLCRSTKISFRHDLLPGIELPSTPYDTDSTSLDRNSSYYKGCYGDGNFTLPGAQAVVSINTTRMKENNTYVVMLVVKKGDRLAFAYQVLEVVVGDPPVIAIECKQNCALKMNPSSRLSVLANCSEGCFGQIIYQWEVYHNEGNKVSKLWRRRDDITEANSVQNPNGPAFALPRDILEGNEEYLIRVYGGRENGAKGRSEYTSVTNDPPRGGRCTGAPAIGEALITDFVLSCSGWSDVDIPLTYEFNHKNEEGKLMLLSFGENKQVTTKLPLGNPQFNFTLEIHVKILDYYKGESSTVFVVQSREPAMEASELGNALAGMTSGEDSALGSLLGVGDFQAVFQMAGAVNSLLNAQSSPAASGSLNETEEQRNNTAKKKAVRDSLIAAAASAPVTSLEDLRQSAGVLSSSTAKKDETSNAAKNASAKAFQNMANVLKQSSGDSAGYDAVVGGAETLLSGMGQVLNAASSSVKLKPKPGKNGTNATVLPTCKPFDFECKKKLEVQPTTMSPTVSQDEDDEDDDDEEEELDGDAAENRDVANNILGMLGSVGGSIVDNKLPGEKATVLATGGMEMTVERADPASLGGSAIGEGPASFKMPSSGDLFKNANSSDMGAVDKQMTAMNENPFTWDKSAAAVSGQVVSLSFSSGSGKLDVSGLAEPMDIFVPRDTKLGPPEKFVYDPTAHRGWRFHRLMIDKNGTAANIEVQNSAPFQLYVRRGKPPRLSDYDWTSSSEQPNNTHGNQSTSTNCSSDAVSIMKEYNESKSADSRFGWLSQSVGALSLGLIPSAVGKFAKSSNCSSVSLDYLASLFMSDKEIHKGLYFIGIKHAGDIEMENGTAAGSNVTYTLRVYKSKCMYWNETKQKWKSNGCEVGNMTNLKRTHCRCTHLTSFGSALNVAPNPIDFSAVAAGFSNMFASGNVVVFFTIVGLFVLYPLLVTWARRADRKDLEQLGATPLQSTVARAKYHYEVTFFTGKGAGCGTTAQVACQLVGHNGDSGPCILKDDQRSVFQKRGINSFIISVGRPLGDITRLRVWHDNHGLSPSWFLKKAVISDCQTGRVWHFLGELWFAVDEGDGLIMRELEPATDEEKTQFNVLFREKIDDGLSNAHLWFSILYKTPRSRFTRVQRITCCLNLLCTGMVASAMFFGQVPEGGDPNAISLGPIKLSLRCIMIGIQSSLVVIPVNVIVMTLFQNSKRKDPPKRKEESEDESGGQFEAIAATEVAYDRIETDSESEAEVDEYGELKTAETELEGQPNKESQEQHSEEAEKVSVENVVCDIHDGQKSKQVEKPDEKSTKRRLWPFGKKKDRSETYLEEDADKDSLCIDSSTGDDAQLTENNNKQGCCSCFCRPKDPEAEKKKEEERKRKAAEKRRKKKNTDGSLPRWCLYVAYALCFFASVTSALFTLFYSMMWGKEKSNGWLVAFLFSFVQDTFINQPLKVFVVSLLVALIIKKPDEDEDLEFAGDPEKGLDEEWLHEDDGNADLQDRQRELIMYQPPSEEQLAAIRERKLQEKDMFDKLKKLVYYVSVLLILLIVSKGNRDQKSYSLRRSLEDGIVEPLSRTRKLEHVVNSVYFWDWAENILVPGLFEHEWYNGDVVINRTGFTEDRANMRMGVVRFRQVRVSNGSCKVNEKFKDVIEECNAVFSKEKEEKRSFKPGWKDGQKDTNSKRNKKASPWEYFTGKEANQSSSVWGRLATYTGGGYIAELGDSATYATNFIHYLKSSSWIDASTRAVFVEGSLYNPSVNLLAVLKVSVEFTAAGTAVPFYNINIMILHRSLSPGYSLYIVCELIYVVILLQLLYAIIKGTYKERKAYYRRVLSWMDVIFFLNGLVVLSLYIVRARFISKAVEILSRDQVSYIGFSDLASYVELVVYLLALADFIAILKFLHFMSFTRSVKLLSETIFQCFVQMQSFSVMFFVVVMAYVVFAYTIFGAYLEGYMDIPSTIGSLFSLLMGVFDIAEFELQSDFKALGRFFFSSFTSIMIFLFLNFFITIINSVYKEVQMDENLTKGQTDLFANLFEKFLMTAGIQEPPKREVPVVEEPTVASIQWDLHVQYITNSQIKRLKKFIRSLKTDDEAWDLYLTENLQRLSGKETGNRGKQEQRHTKLLGNSDALPEKSESLSRQHVHFEECQDSASEEEEDSSEVKSDSQNNKLHDVADAASSSKLGDVDRLVPVTRDQDAICESPQVIKLRNLIYKKERELEGEGEMDERERLRQEKIIGCLKGLLTTAISQDEKQKQQQGMQDTADESSA